MPRRNPLKEKDLLTRKPRELLVSAANARQAIFEETERQPPGGVVPRIVDGRLFITASHHGMQMKVRRDGEGWQDVKKGLWHLAEPGTKVRWTNTEGEEREAHVKAFGEDRDETHAFHYIDLHGDAPRFVFEKRRLAARAGTAPAPSEPPIPIGGVPARITPQPPPAKPGERPSLKVATTQRIIRDPSHADLPPLLARVYLDPSDGKIKLKHEAPVGETLYHLPGHTTHRVLKPGDAPVELARGARVIIGPNVFQLTHPGPQVFQLAITEGPNKGQIHDFAHARTVTFGRSSDNHIVLATPGEEVNLTPPPVPSLPSQPPRDVTGAHRPAAKRARVEPGAPSGRDKTLTPGEVTALAAREAAEREQGGKGAEREFDTAAERFFKRGEAESAEAAAEHARLATAAVGSVHEKHARIALGEFGFQLHNLVDAPVRVKSGGDDLFASLRKGEMRYLGVGTHVHIGEHTLEVVKASQKKGELKLKAVTGPLSGKNFTVSLGSGGIEEAIIGSSKDAHVVLGEKRKWNAWLALSRAKGVLTRPTITVGGSAPEPVSTRDIVIEEENVLEGFKGAENVHNLLRHSPGLYLAVEAAIKNGQISLRVVDEVNRDIVAAGKPTAKTRSKLLTALATLQRDGGPVAAFDALYKLVAKSAANPKLRTSFDALAAKFAARQLKRRK